MNAEMHAMAILARDCHDVDRYQAAIGGLLTLVPVDGGFRVKETAERWVEIHEMLFNWRIVTIRKDQPESVEHGWCYRGRGVAAFLSAALAAAAWDAAGGTSPPGCYKQAFLTMRPLWELYTALARTGGVGMRPVRAIAWIMLWLVLVEAVLIFSDLPLWMALILLWFMNRLAADLTVELMATRWFWRPVCNRDPW